MMSRTSQTKAVAFLGSAGMPQKQIAEALGITQSSVSRLLQEAREEGMIVTTCRLDLDDIEEIQAHLFPERRKLLERFLSLQQNSRETLRAVHIFPAGSKGNGNSETLRLTAFASFAFPHFDTAVQKSRIVGVGWGRTIAALATSVRDTGSTSRGKQSHLIFPLCGEPLNCPSTEFCSSKNVFRVASNLSLNESDLLSLSAIPARFPKQFPPSRIRFIREFMQSSDAYRRIFTGESSCLWTADCMVLSGGTASTRRPEDPIVADLLRFEQLSEATLSRLFSGDLAGALVPRQGLSASDRKLCKDIATRWNGASFEQITACAHRAHKSGDAGVLFFACGPAKAEIVIFSVRNGMVNEIVIDDLLARSLLVTLA